MMSDLGKLAEGKTLGGIGSILQLIPGVNLVGYILILIAVKYISDELQDKSIFDNMLYAVIAGIVGVAVGLGALLTGALLSFFTFGLTAILGILSFLLVVWISLVISSIYIRRSFNTIATRLSAPNFRTAGTLYFVGALLTILFFVGLILIFVAFIFQIIAFSSIQDSASPQTPQAQTSGRARPPWGTKYCPNCGTQISASTVFCPKCGTKQP